MSAVLELPVPKVVDEEPREIDGQIREGVRRRDSDGDEADMREESIGLGVEGGPSVREKGGDPESPVGPASREVSHLLKR